MALEEWKYIENTNNRYMINNYGKIKSLGQPNNPRVHNKDIILKSSISQKGYERVCLYIKDERKTLQIHRLVAEAFIPNLENKPQVNHIDGNKLNNNVNNLEWCTNSENQIHANKNGLNKNRMKRLLEVVSKPIIQYDLNHNIINKFPNARIANKETGINYKTISYQCNHLIKKSKYGCIFRFEE